ncbi:hypothetical protein FKP32DRAFT_1289203 [Trametes sanguinea]|nr:hypothetical protein FKP32DRAFT_1289203 [Trametes sanguinea]
MPRGGGTIIHQLTRDAPTEGHHTVDRVIVLARDDKPCMYELIFKLAHFVGDAPPRTMTVSSLLMSGYGARAHAEVGERHRAGRSGCAIEVLFALGKEADLAYFDPLLGLVRSLLYNRIVRLRQSEPTGLAILLCIPR